MNVLQQANATRCRENQLANERLNQMHAHPVSDPGDDDDADSDDDDSDDEATTDDELTITLPPYFPDPPGEPVGVFSPVGILPGLSL